MVPDPKLESTSAQHFSFATFENFIKQVVVEPLGSRLYQPVHDLISELDLPSSFIILLKDKQS